MSCSGPLPEKEGKTVFIPIRGLTILWLIGFLHIEFYYCMFIVSFSTTA